MEISFATCSRHLALEYLQKVYPSKVITDSEDSAKDFLDFVEKDIVRVQDPMMYGQRIQVVQSKNWDDSLSEKIMASIKKFHE